MVTKVQRQNITNARIRNSVLVGMIDEFGQLNDTLEPLKPTITKHKALKEKLKKQVSVGSVNGNSYCLTISLGDYTYFDIEAAKAELGAATIAKFMTTGTRRFVNVEKIKKRKKIAP